MSFQSESNLPPHRSPEEELIREAQLQTLAIVGNPATPLGVSAVAPDYITPQSESGDPQFPFMVDYDAINDSDRPIWVDGVVYEVTS